MQLEPYDVETALESLRGLGAVTMIQGGGRVEKFRHVLYDWLGVDKVEMAVMTELLLRGAQTEGELRGRAARMDPIPDLAALRPILDSLRAKNLVISLTPEGRGHVVSHNLYKPSELEKLRAQFSSGRTPASEPDEEGPSVAAAPAAAAPRPAQPPAPAGGAVAAASLDGLRRELAALGQLLHELQAAVAELHDKQERTAAELHDKQERTADELHDLKRALGA
jgi:hypothetical protein